MRSPRTAIHFFDDRWEQDRIEHFYYLETAAYRRLSSIAKHAVVKGHRGTGKTTLLKALDWRERISNKHLARALQGKPFADGVVGCFMQIKLMPVDMLDIWLSDSSRTVRFALISTYLRSAWLVEAVDALIGLNAGLHYCSFADEVDDFASVSETVWTWSAQSLDIDSPADRATLTLENIRFIANEVMRSIRASAAIGTIAPEVLVAKFDLQPFAAIVSRLFTQMAANLRRLDASSSWIFRVCMDEGEFLSDEWALVVRSLIRETDGPVYLAVSVLQTLGSETRQVGAELSIDDRELIDLDDRSPEELGALMAGIVRARFQMIGAGPRRFDVKTFLGNPDVDELCRRAVAKSENRSAEIQLRALGEAPIRQHLKNVGAIASGAVASRSEQSSGYRKKKTAGYLHLLGAIGINRPFYAGWRIATAMSDNSVRDFLRFLRYSFEIAVNREDYDGSLDEILTFLSKSRLSFDIQDAALERLGRRKLDSIPQNLTDPGEAEILIRLFGELAHRSDFYAALPLTKPNATRMAVRASPRDGGDPSFDDVKRVLVRAASYGYIADLRLGNGQVVKFRLNLSLARHLGFSYWKPQYETVVPFRLVRAAVLSPDMPVTRLMSRTYRRSVEAASQTMLPGFELD